METKLCKNCNKEKTLDNFYYRKKRNTYESICTPCCNNRTKLKRQINNEVHEKCKEACKRYNQKNKKTIIDKHKEYYMKNKEVLKSNMKEYYQDNKEEALLYAKKYRKELKEKIQSDNIAKPDIENKTCNNCYINKNISNFTYRKTRNVYESNCKTCNAIRERNRRANNGNSINIKRRLNKKPKTIQQKLKESLRKRLNTLVKNRQRKNLYSDLLGCEVAFLMEWFEYIFRLDKHLNMEWSNYGKIWQIDHVTPCASFDMTNMQNQKTCFNWTNLCPVLKSYNLSKQAKIVPIDQLKQIERVKNFTNLQYMITQNEFLYVQKL